MNARALFWGRFALVMFGLGMGLGWFSVGAGASGWWLAVDVVGITINAVLFGWQLHWVLGS